MRLPRLSAVGKDLVGGSGLFHELVQLVVLIVYTLILDSFKHQITQSIVGIIGQFFCDVAGHHTVQLIVGVDIIGVFGSAFETGEAAGSRLSLRLPLLEQLLTAFFPYSHLMTTRP